MNARMKQSAWLLIAAVVVALDLWTKSLATQMLQYGRPLEILPVLDFTLLHNRGAAFSFLSSAGGWQRWVFTLIALAVSTVLLVWTLQLKPHERWLSVTLPLILGGALGNLYDRLTLGYVVDFVHFHWQGRYFPAFNIADAAITAGAIMMIIDALWLQPRRNANTKPS
ncbi:signal peptidase II [Saccharospirillum impatiens]|uniref:signal peptidase II n=1 Tax=Saccharospirillum impatiens TaxID=169438 RepID=UPI0004910044|nr:signal peptidase II [Saccharospirillum impatiens]